MNFHSLINLKGLKKEAKLFKKRKPFNYLIIDNFLDTSFANKLEKEIPNYNDEMWHEYNNPIEFKKLTNNWNHFKSNTYNIFSYLTSEKFSKELETNLKIRNIINDPGLHGGGIHIHKNGGKLNPHLDYFIHPKNNCIRKLNLLIYLNKNWKESYGGHLGFWEKKKGGLILKKEILPKFNRAVIFDTSKNSWHGLSREVKSKNKIYRKHFAVYYLINNKGNLNGRKKALFEATNDQKNNLEIRNLIKIRSNQKLWELEKKKINKK